MKWRKRLVNDGGAAAPELWKRLFMQSGSDADGASGAIHRRRGAGRLGSIHM